MYNGLLHLHSVLRWLILIHLLVALYKSFADRAKPFTTSHRKTGMVLMICADIMLALGIYQWIASPQWGLNSIKLNGFSEVMKNPKLRFFAIEHFSGMLIAIILIHLGYSYAKKDVPDAVKHKRTLLFYGLALLIILIVIPWPFRTGGIERPLFPGL